MDRKSFQAVPLWAAVTMKSAKLVSILKLMKFTKIIVTASTLALSTVAYGWAFGPWFGVGLIAMLTIHEMGHVIALRWKGYPISLPVFIPFLGAVIFTKDHGDRETEAYIGYGGPLLGSIAAFLCMAAGLLTGSSLLLLTAFLGVYLNLFNMLPIRPLDGGRNHPASRPQAEIHRDRPAGRLHAVRPRAGAAVDLGVPAPGDQVPAVVAHRDRRRSHRADGARVRV